MSTLQVLALLILFAAAICIIAGLSSEVSDIVMTRGLALGTTGAMVLCADYGMRHHDMGDFKDAITALGFLTLLFFFGPMLHREPKGGAQDNPTIPPRSRR